MQIERSSEMFPLEVEAKEGAPQTGMATSKSRFLAFGSATLLAIAGVVVLRSARLGPNGTDGPGGATNLLAQDSLVDQDDLIYPPEVPSYTSGSAPEPSISKIPDEFTHLTCDVLPIALADAFGNAEVSLHQRCLGRRCGFGDDMAQAEVDALVNAAKSIFEHVRVADQKDCLSETMADIVVQERAQSIDDLWSGVIAGASTEPSVAWDGEASASVRERLAQSHAGIGAWRGGALAGADAIIDRRLIFPRNVEDVMVCPKPCIRCTTHHNSFYLEAEFFSFKCILPDGGEAPSGPDISCPTPVRRSGIAGTLHRQTKTWCDVRSWHQAHDQAVALAADVKCGSEAILGPLRHGIDMEERTREACQSVERGEPTEALDVQAYREFVTIDDGVASLGEIAAFRVFMELGVARGVADLRRATRGNRGLTVVVESSV